MAQIGFLKRLEPKLIIYWLIVSPLRTLLVNFDSTIYNSLVGMDDTNNIIHGIRDEIVPTKKTII